jgi:hypothetical protein
MILKLECREWIREVKLLYRVAKLPFLPFNGLV